MRGKDPSSMSSLTTVSWGAGTRRRLWQGLFRGSSGGHTPHLEPNLASLWPSTQCSSPQESTIHQEGPEDTGT